MNVLNVIEQETVLALLRRGWSFRRVARETGVHRETVARLWRECLGPPKPAKTPTGSESEGAEAKPAKMPTGACAAYRAPISEWMELGWTARKIHQVLIQEHGFERGYDQVKRYVRRLGRTTVLPFRRMESGPGEEAQLDFGKGCPVIGSEGTRRWPWIVRIVLSCSRRAYSEAIWRLDTTSVLAVTERAWMHFGGSPAKLVIDNFKAAVAHAEWSEAILTPRMAEFGRHYSLAVLACAPRRPEHKGKVEAGIHYVQMALRGEAFPSIEAMNLFLAQWESTVADVRIHGTTKEQVLGRFERLERPALRPLPAESFPLFQEGRRSVQADAYVEVAKAYYSVPPEYVGREVWVRWDDRMVRVFDERFQAVTVHLRGEQGSFTTTANHIDPRKRSRRELGREALLAALTLIGPRTVNWGEGVLAARGLEGERALIGVAQIGRQYGALVLEVGAERATSAGQWHLPQLRDQCRQLALQHRDGVVLTQRHPLIRDLQDYAGLAPFPHEPQSAQTTSA
jgi:transposase